MTKRAHGSLIRWGALAIGILLFAAALYYINLSLAVGHDSASRPGAAAGAVVQRHLAPGADLGVGMVLPGTPAASRFCGWLACVWPPRPSATSRFAGSPVSR